jgi:hypothetical protein
VKSGQSLQGIDQSGPDARTKFAQTTSCTASEGPNFDRATNSRAAPQAHNRITRQSTRSLGGSSATVRTLTGPEGPDISGKIKVTHFIDLSPILTGCESRGIGASPVARLLCV